MNPKNTVLFCQKYFNNKDYFSCLVLEQICSITAVITSILGNSQKQPPNCSKKYCSSGVGAINN